MATAFVGVGSNLDDPAHQVREAIRALASTAGVATLRSSSLYRTRPWGDPDQPDFVNAVVELECALPARDLMKALLAIESSQGRRRSGRRWGPRIIDLDLLAYGQQRIDDPDLKVPHPELARRAFVLVPWAELAPTFDLPGLGTVESLLNELKQRAPDRDAPRLLE